MGKRTYDQACALARALDVVGERWTFLLIRELMIGPCRFVDLLRNLPGIGTNLLTERLKQLEAWELIEKRELPPPAASSVYQLASRGRALVPAVLELVRWGLSLPAPEAPAQHSRPEWDIVALRAVFDAERAAGVRLRAQFVVEDFPYRVDIHDGELLVEPGNTEDPDFTVRTDRQTLAEVTRRGGWMETQDTGGFEVEGDKNWAAEFIRTLRIPAL
ncbi:MAG: HxlR family transcriptional regulator [Spirochaetes bacterium]|jgi:DNA-binding HxlR family transcriptional regulator|nr:HxlR family transcriptional regulator [Spirochaetota bacterium]